MNLLKRLIPPGWLVAVLILCVASAGSADAAARQYYSKYWVRNGAYNYKHYRYQPTAGAGYKYHHVVYYPTRPRYYYYYNPYTKKYWGRFDIAANGYSLLAAVDQTEKIADIPEKAFPKPAPMPDVPESKDGVKMDTPPVDDGPPPPPPSEVLPEQTKAQIKEIRPELTEKDPPRETFSGWCKQDDYYYCNYYCKPATTTYHVHRCIYYPTQPKYVYYYNPAKDKCWGRYDVEAKGYSLLEEKDRKSKISDIPESAFPKPGELPPIPGSKDGVKMVKPPGVVGLLENE